MLCVGWTATEYLNIMHKVISCTQKEHFIKSTNAGIDLLIKLI